MPRKRPDLRAAWIIAWASLTVAAVGLGTTTSRPALRASTVGPQWRWSGVLAWTAAGLTLARRSRWLVKRREGGTPARSENQLRYCSFGSATAQISSMSE